MSLQEVLNYSEVGSQLDTLINARRLPHAVVLESRDTFLSKKTATELAKACVCTSSGLRPCGNCVGCKKVQEGIHPDVYTVEITDKKQSIGVGEIRTMISDCYIKPNEAPCKVYFIFDRMTAEAQNALLKILEEPPQNVQFIITSESSSVLLQTVLSRSTVFNLNNDGISAKHSARDDKAQEIAVEIAEAVPQNIEFPLLIATGKLVNDKALAEKVLDKLREFFSLALEEKYLHTGRQPIYISEMARNLHKRSLVRLLDVTVKAQKMLSQNCNMNLLATWLCANIRQSRHTD